MRFFTFEVIIKGTAYIMMWSRDKHKIEEFWNDITITNNKFKDPLRSVEVSPIIRLDTRIPSESTPLVELASQLKGSDLVCLPVNIAETGYILKVLSRSVPYIKDLHPKEAFVKSYDALIVDPLLAAAIFVDIFLFDA